MKKPETTHTTTRTTISMPSRLYEKAIIRKETAGYSGFSDYIQELIRSDERQGILAPKGKQWQNLKLAS